MNQLNWTTNKKAHEYMRNRASQNKVKSKNNPNEQWAKNLLGTTRYKWTQQSQWGYRIFDFWCAELGVAIEIDGPEHDTNYDSYRDEYNYRRSAVVVLRVPNRDEVRLLKVINAIPLMGTWKERRQLLGVAEGTKQERKALANLPEYPRLLPVYLSKFGL